MAVRSAVAWAGLLALLILLIVPAAFAGAVTSPNSDLTIAGYVQVRGDLTIDTGINKSCCGPTLNFFVKRSYINLASDIDKKTRMGILLGHMSSDFTVLEAYGVYDLGKTTWRAGKYRNLYGYESSLSSARLTTLERSQVIQNLIYVPWSFDSGVFGEFKGKSNPAGDEMLCIAVTNGEPFWSGGESDATKNVLIRAVKETKSATTGVNLFTGKAGAGVTNYVAGEEFTYFGVDTMGKKDDLTYIIEVLGGKQGATVVGGGYITVAQKKADSNLTKYLRFDTYTNGGTNGVVTIGQSRQISPTTKTTVELYDLGGSETLTGQYQTVF
jgi:hypothetical protein